MGGSGGGGGLFPGSSPSKQQELIRQEEADRAEETFIPKLTELLNDYLSKANERDTELVNERLEDIKSSLNDEIEEKIDLKLGGSVAKHTYVDGISDIDSLLVLKTDNIKDLSPDNIKQVAKECLERRLPGVEVSKGRIAITVRYPDGMEVQLIPAAKVGDKIHVPAWKGNEWSQINPTKFTQALTRHNSKCNGKLIPTIKLAKAINSNLPEKLQLSGYHIESLGINAFRNYSGPWVTSKMLPHLIERISSDVLSPVTDSTGQSIHVDGYLGPKNSDARKQMSHVYERLSKRMKNATGAQSINQWKTLFNDSDV